LKFIKQCVIAVSTLLIDQQLINVGMSKWRIKICSKYFNHSNFLQTIIRILFREHHTFGSVTSYDISWMNSTHVIVIKEHRVWIGVIEWVKRWHWDGCNRVDRKVVGTVMGVIGYVKTCH
jgi:hypothetical protein